MYVFHSRDCIEQITSGDFDHVTDTCYASKISYYRLISTEFIGSVPDPRDLSDNRKRSGQCGLRFRSFKQETLGTTCDTHECRVLCMKSAFCLFFDLIPGFIDCVGSRSIIATSMKPPVVETSKAIPLPCPETDQVLCPGFRSDLFFIH